MPHEYAVMIPEEVTEQTAWSGLQGSQPPLSTASNCLTWTTAIETEHWNQTNIQLNNNIYIGKELHTTLRTFGPYVCPAYDNLDGGHATPVPLIQWWLEPGTLIRELRWPGNTQDRVIHIVLNAQFSILFRDHLPSHLFALMRLDKISTLAVIPVFEVYCEYTLQLAMNISQMLSAFQPATSGMYCLPLLYASGFLSNRASTMDQNLKDSLSPSKLLGVDYNERGFYTKYANMCFDTRVKPAIEFGGDFTRVMTAWTWKEIRESRRLLKVDHIQTGMAIRANCSIVHTEQYDSINLFISCIWWPDRKMAFITYQDLIQLSQSILAVYFTSGQKQSAYETLTRNGLERLTDGERFWNHVKQFAEPQYHGKTNDVFILPWVGIEAAIDMFSAQSTRRRYARSHVSPLKVPQGFHIELKKLAEHASQEFPREVFLSQNMENLVVIRIRYLTYASGEVEIPVIDLMLDDEYSVRLQECSGNEERGISITVNSSACDNFQRRWDYYAKKDLSLGHALSMLERTKKYLALGHLLREGFLETRKYPRAQILSGGFDTSVPFLTWTNEERKIGRRILAVTFGNNKLWFERCQIEDSEPVRALVISAIFVPNDLVITDTDIRRLINRVVATRGGDSRYNLAMSIVKREFIEYAVGAVKPEDQVRIMSYSRPKAWHYTAASSLYRLTVDTVRKIEDISDNWA